MHRLTDSPSPLPPTASLFLHFTLPNPTGGLAFAFRLRLFLLRFCFRCFCVRCFCVRSFWFRFSPRPTHAPTADVLHFRLAFRFRFLAARLSAAAASAAADFRHSPWNLLRAAKSRQSTMATEGAAAATAPSPTEGIRLLISSVNVDASEAALAKAEAADAAEAARRRRGKLAADDDEEEEDDEDLDAQDEEEDDDAGAAQRTAHFTRRVAGTFHRGSDRFKFHDDDTPTAAAAAASARSAAEKFTPKDIAEKLLSAKEREAARQLKIRQAEEQDEEEAVDELGEIRHRDAPRSMRKLMQAPELPTISVAPDRQVMLLRYAHSHLALSAVSAPELHLAGMLIDTRAFGPSKPSLAHLATVIEISEDVGQRVDFNTASSATPAPQEATPGGTKPRSSSVDGIELPVQGLPKNYRVAHGRWSPDSMFCALVLIVPSAVQLLAAGGTAASTTEASNSAKSQPDDGDEPSTPQRVDTYELWVVERSTLQASLVSPLALHCVIDARHAVMWGGDSRTLV